MRDGSPSATPVFVDPTGRRAKGMRAFGSLAALTALAFLVAVALVMTAFPQPPQAGGGPDVRANAHTAVQSGSAQSDSAHSASAVSGADPGPQRAAAR